MENQINPTATNTLNVEDFTKQPEVVDCLAKLRTHFNNGNQFIISDVLDSNGHQYVNLVQKGGGVLGVALVGYTYILEEMGVRFIRLAGTSAGAINTALMAVAGATKDASCTISANKKAKKSTQILEEICKLKFIDLVDGHPAAKFIIKRFIKTKDFVGRLKSCIIVIIATVIILPLLTFISFGFERHYPSVSHVTNFLFVLMGLVAVVLVGIIGYAIYLVKRLKTAGYGINPGHFFYDWVKAIFTKNHVETVSDLLTVASTPVADLRLREGIVSTENLNDLDGDVTFITSEIVSMNKIEFPKMASLFRNNINDLQPAGFVRASMSIPLFFESYYIKDIPCADQQVNKNWVETFGEDDPPSTARFVDGGILSNFPINLFYNAKVSVPRLPSLGIDLDDTLDPDLVFPDPNRPIKPAPLTDDKSKNPDAWSLGGYIGRIFNTVRFYYDKDFLIKNAFFKKGIGTIPLKGFGWLNFFLEDAEKKKMFVLGAKAATDFLIHFNWNEYKSGRVEMQKNLINATVNPSDEKL